MSRPQTIQIFLPAGDPSGLRTAEITTHIVRVFEVPRSLLDEFLKTDESRQVGIYLLVGQGDDATDPGLYIGQSSNVGARLVQHNQNKDFWTRTLVAVSLTNSFTQTHTVFLEWHAIREAKVAGRYRLENGTAGSQPYTPAPLKADCLEIFDTLRVLVATLGHPVFEPLAKPAEGPTEQPLFFCTASGTNGRGMYTPEGFVVFKGSVGRLENVKSIKGTAGENLRQRLLDTGVMRPEGATVIFERDHLFRSPSMAALALLGRTCNGWTDWKDIQGRTLDQVVRQKNNYTTATES
jgi:predicted GIY-YIG superfamily endonuclease